MQLHRTHVFRHETSSIRCLAVLLGNVCQTIQHLYATWRRSTWNSRKSFEPKSKWPVDILLTWDGWTDIGWTIISNTSNGVSRFKSKGDTAMCHQVLDLDSTSHFVHKLHVKSHKEAWQAGKPFKIDFPHWKQLMWGSPQPGCTCHLTKGWNFFGQAARVASWSLDVQQTKKNQSLALSQPPAPRHQSLETKNHILEMRPLVHTGIQLVMYDSKWALGLKLVKHQLNVKLDWRDMRDACAALNIPKDQNEFHRNFTDLRQNKGTRALVILSQLVDVLTRWQFTATLVSLDICRTRRLRHHWIICQCLIFLPEQVTHRACTPRLGAVWKSLLFHAWHT